ncbi:MAG: hypothetical protein C0506_01040 [Anaerolinea sp.]|nr:hypothetical protein [Anaerolinea sp.]
MAVAGLVLGLALLVGGVKAAGVAPPDDGGLPRLREYVMTMVFPSQPELGTLTVVMFLPQDLDDPALAAAGREAMLARFPGAVDLEPGEVRAQYRLDNVRWPQPSATWRYNPYEASTRIGADAALAAISAGAAGWTNAGGSGFAYSFEGYTGTPPGCDGRLGVLPKDGENVVGWGHVEGGFWGFTCWWSSAANVPETSYKTLTEFDIVFESSSTVPYTPGVLKALALHEFGHALGLAHTQDTSCPGVVMCGGSAATIQQTITPDDVAGVLALYGVAPTPTPSSSPKPAFTATPTPTVFPPGSKKHMNWVPAVARD